MVTEKGRAITAKICQGTRQIALWNGPAGIQLFSTVTDRRKKGKFKGNR